MPIKHSRKFIVLIITATILCMSFSFALDNVGISPRRLAIYVEHRAAGHNPVIEDIGAWLGNLLRAQDRINIHPLDLSTLDVGAQNETLLQKTTPLGRIITVSSAADAIKAIEHARPGDIITFLPGTYRFSGGRHIHAENAGAPDHRIIVRAKQPGTAHIEMDLLEGFLVTAPYWTFENLSIRGICRYHSKCEHAFHIVGRANHFTARNNTITDFNAHFKINGKDNYFPDYGVIENNTLSNSVSRKTGNPVTPIDIDAASHWVIRHNMITDFIKSGGNRISYGAYAKGAGEDNLFEQNIIICENHIRYVHGQRIGISLGGGGTGRKFCRDRRCKTEQKSSAIESNLIVSCSNDGIYINRSVNSIIRHNTLIDTGPITVRFPESTASIKENIVDSSIESRNGGILHASNNRQTSMTYLYLGLHPVRRLFTDVKTFDFTWVSAPPRSKTDSLDIPDLCSGERPSKPIYGAFEDFSKCKLLPNPGRNG